jgi:hypothetical protein
MADLEFSGQIAHLYHLSEFVQVAFLDSQDSEFNFLRPFDTFKHWFIDFFKFIFLDFQKADYVLRQNAYLKHHLSDFNQVAFFDARDAENITWPFDTLKHSFVDFNCRFLKCPEGRIRVLRPIRLLKISLKRLSITFFYTPRM